MMNKEELIRQIQEYLEGNLTDLEFEPDMGLDDLQAFYCRTAKRLKVAFQLYEKDSRYQNDFLIALRDFLLVFETGLSIDSIEIPDDNAYAIKKNNSTGKYFSSFQFPDGVATELDEQAFMRNIASNGRSKKEYNLMTDSLIYGVTGF